MKKVRVSLLYGILATIALMGIVRLLWAAIPSGSPVLYSPADTVNIPILLLQQYLRLGQQSVDPATPATNTWNLYTKSGGLFLQNSSGTVYTLPLSLGSGYNTVQDESLPLTQQTVLNFIGAGVTVTNNSGAGSTDISIPGGGGSANEWAPVAAATTANINLSSPGSTHDGVTLAVTTPRQRLLVWKQSTATDNGLYTYEGATSALIRSTDADAGSEFVNNMGVYVQSGTLYGGSTFRLQNTGAVTLGSTNISFARDPSKAKYADDVNVNSGILGLTSAGKVPHDRLGTYAAASALAASSQVPVTALTMGIEGSGGAVTQNSSPNPRIAAGVDGQLLILEGTHVTNTFTIPNGQGVRWCGNTGSVTIGLHAEKPLLKYSSGQSLWNRLDCPSLQTAFNSNNAILTGSTAATGLRWGDVASGNYCSMFFDASNGNIPTIQCFCGGAACDSIVQLSSGKDFFIKKNDGSNLFRVNNDSGSITGIPANKTLVMGHDVSTLATCSSGGDSFYQAPSGRTGSSTEALVQMISPETRTISTLYVRTVNAVPAGITQRFTYRKNGVAQSLTCSVTAGNQTCNDITNSFSVAAGDRVSVEMFCSGGTSLENNYAFSTIWQ